METSIKGGNNGNVMEVDDLKRGHVRSLTTDEMSDVSRRTGRAYLLSSRFVSLTTTGSFNGVLYLKNNSADDLGVYNVRSCGDGSGNAQVKFIANPKSGTLVSDANKSLQRSVNLGKQIPFDGDSFSASGDGKTITDGEDLTQFINKMPGHSVQEYRGLLILPRGASLAVVIKPSVATTVCIELQAAYL